MKTKIILISILAFLICVIIVLTILLIKPPFQNSKMTFNYLMRLTQEKRNNLKFINITYGVKLFLNSKNITGEMNFFKNKTNKAVSFSQNLRVYKNYGIMLSPEKLIKFINTSNRREYSGELGNRNITCWSTITEPEGNYPKLTNGDYLFITCFNKKTGYPELVYASETSKKETIYSKFFIKNIAYSN